MSDAFDQKLRAGDYCRGFPSVSLALEIPVGPRSIKAGLTISYEGQYPLEFESKVSWPQNESFESAIREGMLAVLLKDGSPLVGGRFRLVAVEVDEIHSSSSAFRLVAVEATLTLLRILRVRKEDAEPTATDNSGELRSPPCLS